MKAFVVDKYAKTGTLRLAQMPEPRLLDNEVLVEVHAAGVNLIDSKIKSGEFKAFLPYRVPFVLGHDVAGKIIKVGSRVSKYKAGDEIYARPRDQHIGTFAEFIAIDEADIALKPKNLTMVEAASIPLVGLTAWQALANVKKGQKVFIQAGSGGVGTFAIQLAKHLGAIVATTTSSKNVEFVKSLGADLVIDYTRQDFETALSDYDFVLNSQDAKTLEKSFSVLKPGGQLSSISGPPDSAFAKDLGLNPILRLVIYFLSRAARKKASALGVGYSFLFMKANGVQLAQISTLLEIGAIKPAVDKVFPFEKTNEALAYVETGRAKGKVVISMK